MKIGSPDVPANAPPPIPRGLFPEEYVVECPEMFRMSCDHWPTTTAYDFEIQNYNSNNSSWVAYVTLNVNTNVKNLSPQILNTDYRFRARGRNSYGTSAWSDWSYFHYNDGSCPVITP